jgi:hypothetical protein
MLTCSITTLHTEGLAENSHFCLLRGRYPEDKLIILAGILRFSFVPYDSTLKHLIAANF